jgi:hypothetical protein
LRWRKRSNTNRIERRDLGTDAQVIVGERAAVGALEGVTVGKKEGVIEGKCDGTSVRDTEG